MLSHFDTLDERRILLRFRDPFHIMRQYMASGSILTNSRMQFFLALARNLWWYDMSWIHSIAYRWSRHQWLKYVMRKPFVLHYHGTGPRRIPLSVRAKYERRAARVLVSSSDLLEHEYAQPPQLFYRLIDTTLFTSSKVPENQKGLCMLKPTQTAPDAMRMLEERGWGDVDWRFVHRTYHPRLPGEENRLVDRIDYDYADMPGVLAQYQYFADLPMEDGQFINEFSMTGLQAMCVGCTVIDIHGDSHTTMPPSHKPESVCALANQIVSECLEQ